MGILLLTSVFILFARSVEEDSVAFSTSVYYRTGYGIYRWYTKRRTFCKSDYIRIYPNGRSRSRRFLYMIYLIYQVGRYTTIGTLYEGVYIYHTPLGRFFNPKLNLLDNQDGANTERHNAFGKLTARCCSNADLFLAPVLFQLWRYRAWKIGPGGV